MRLKIWVGADGQYETVFLWVAVIAVALSGIPILTSAMPFPCSVTSLGRCGIPQRPRLPCLDKGTAADRSLVGAHGGRIGSGQVHRRRTRQPGRAKNLSPDALHFFLRPMAGLTVALPRRDVGGAGRRGFADWGHRPTQFSNPQSSRVRPAGPSTGWHSARVPHPPSPRPPVSSHVQSVRRLGSPVPPTGSIRCQVHI